MRAASSSIDWAMPRSEEHTSELQSRVDLVCRLLLEKKKQCLATVRRPGSREPPWVAHAPPCPSPARTASNRPPNSGSFSFNNPATPEIYTLSLHDALPI